MLIIVEDGTGVVGANSYVSLAYADEYFSAHPFYSDQWSDLNLNQRHHLLIFATTQINNLFNWYGFRSYNEQVLDWPRQRVWYAQQRDYYASNAIPSALKQATCEMAYFLSKGDVFGDSSSEGLESLKIDVIELNFGNSKRKAPVPAAALTLLRGLGDYAYGGRVQKVLVG